MTSFRARSSEKGVALVVALSLIVLLTILVTSYLVSMQLDRQSTQNYSQSVKAQELALGAMQEIVGDLKMEMEAGSLQDPAKYVVNGKRVYIPASAKSALPARIGFTADKFGLDASSDQLPPTLIRVSRAADPFFTASSTDYPGTLPPNRASSAKSTDESANRRTVSPARWNKIQMMGKVNPLGADKDLLPPGNFVSAPPDWVYVTREGSRVFQTADLASMKLGKDLGQGSAVLGRYAFVIYEEGGTLDVNSAGYPSALSSATAGAEAIRGKSALAYADLIQLPGMTGKESALNQLLDWRSKGSLAAPAYGAGNFVTMIQKLLPEGFMKFQPGDSPLLSRQDLIDYFKKRTGTTAPLPYLGTFSRSLNAPSWAPEKPSGSTIDYAANADSATSANRNLANVRFKISSGGNANITHYNDDAVAATYQVSDGDPLLQSKFSLAKLAWLAQANPDTGVGPTLASTYGTAIKAVFGLVWDHPGGKGGVYSANGGNKCWNYVGPTGSLSSPPGTIKTLDQVASENREPDFFELLKAAILSGSLGKGPGKAAFNNGFDGVLYPGGGTKYDTHSSTTAHRTGAAGLYANNLDFEGADPDKFKSPARIEDMQIIAIGANIIDQYDADSYPTAVYFKYAGIGSYDPVEPLGNPLLGPVTMVYGNENLPYLTKMMQINCSPSRTGSANEGTVADNGTSSLAGWRQPEVWNPHQKPPSSVTPVGLPRNFQIRAYGAAQTNWAGNPLNGTPMPGTWAPGLYDGGWRKSGLSEIVEYFGVGADANKASATSPVGTINLKDDNPVSSFYSRPYVLTTDGMPSGVTASSPANTPAQPPSGNNVAMNTYPHWSSTGDSTYNNYTNHFVAFCTGVTVTTPPNLTNSYQPFHVFGHTFCNVGSNAVDKGLGPANSYAMGWVDSSGGFHPYSFLTGAFTYSYGVFTLDNTSNDTRVGSVIREKGNYCMWGLPDPRTGRFSLNFNYFSSTPHANNTVFPRNGTNWTYGLNPHPDAKFYYSGSTTQRDWSANKTSGAYYEDQDGVVRPGDAVFATPGSGDGQMLLISNSNPTGGNYASGDSAGNTEHGRRPIILNRPFRSVGELGYVFRDQPFKTLDFFSQYSADAALLDVFSTVDRSTITDGKLRSVVSGQFNPNTAPVSVFKAVLKGAAKKDADASYSLNTEVTTLATNIVAKLNPTTGSTPVKNTGGLVAALGGDTAGVGVSRSSFVNSSDKGNKAYLEAPIRALADTANVRTWNLLIDVVAQSGRMSPGATSLDQFVVEGERRYWLHVAMDRYTGEIVDQQMEAVYE